MNRGQLAKRLIYLIFLILAVNFVANKLYWFSAIWYLDLVLHFLGRVWVGLLFFYILSPSHISIRLVMQILFFTLMVAIGWEVFEALVNDVILNNPFNYPDTISDLLLGVAGGGMAVFYFLKRIMLVEKNTVY